MSRYGKCVRRSAVLLGVLGGLLLGSQPALAHVSVVPDTAPGGSTGVLTFRVPNERENSSTVKVEVFLPEGQPIPSVTPAPVPGWHATTVGKPGNRSARSGTSTAGVSSVVWDGGAIPPGRSADFSVSMGPLPQRGSLVFKALQTYADGAVARWIEEPAPGGVDPEHPAAVLTLTPGEPAAAAGAPADPDAWYVLPGAIALTGLLACAVGLVHRRSRRAPAPVRQTPAGQAASASQAEIPGGR